MGRRVHPEGWNGSHGRQPSNLPQTFEQMVASNEASKPKKQSRRELIEANKNEISSLVGNLADQLEANERNRNKVNLRDTERVKEITFQYIRSCQVTGTLPTLTGLALACGYSRYSIDRYIGRNPDDDTTKWIQLLRDNFGNILNQAALDGSVAQIQAIFALKAAYGWRDDPEPEVRNNNDQEELTPDAIAAKYSDLPD